MSADDQSEVSRMQARIDALENDLRRERRRRVGGRDTTTAYADLFDRKRDESALLFRGFVNAALEGVGVVTDAASYWVEDVLDQNAAYVDESPADVARRLPSDMSRRFGRAVERTFDVPRRAADRFSQTYAEGPPASSRRRRPASRAADATEAAGSGDEYDSYSKTELYERAQELDIERRSEMSKEELLAAIRSHES